MWKHGCLLTLLVFHSIAASAETEVWSIHFQATTVSQGHTVFPADYTGRNSLVPSPEFDTSVTSTLYLGRKLWHLGELYFNPEISGGSGLSSTQGVAGFPNGEIYRISSATPKIYPSRFFYRQSFALSDETLEIPADQNQLAGPSPRRKFTVTLGKFALTDLFDRNSYADDPRTLFLNWALMDNAAWDYAAETRGYTYGFMLEYSDFMVENRGWALRFSEAMVPTEANQSTFDANITQARAENFEAQYSYLFQSHPGIVRFLVYVNHAHMGSYSEVLSNPNLGMDITKTRAYRTKWGLGLNWEQELTADLGGFLRLGWDDGEEETWMFTEVDRTLTFGIKWKELGVGFVLNGLSGNHASYLAAGGYGFIIGDGALHYAPEEIIEIFYSLKILTGLFFTADFQFVNHPAYNLDRGPVPILAGRFHYEL